MKDILIETQNGLDDCTIELVQKIEKDLDSVMVSNGFTRTSTTKASNFLKFNYKQFGKVK